jgi:allantoin racemase
MLPSSNGVCRLTRPLILLVNGNSRVELTNRMASMAREKLGDLADVEAMTIASAPPFVSTRAQATEAAGAILTSVRARLAQANARRPDAVMLACFGEPGLWALREEISMPVTGMVEASVAAAMQLGRRIAILTSGSNWPSQIEDLLQTYGQSDRITRVTGLPDAALSEDRAIWHRALTEAVAQEVARGGADVLILGGGPLSGRAATLTLPTGVPLIDAFDATLWQSFALATLTLSTGPV